MAPGAGPCDDCGMQTIVVGVDGSPASRDALVWALDEARLREARLTVVHAWAVPLTAYATPYGAVLTDDLIAANRDTANDLLDNLLDDMDTTGVDVQRTIVEGPAAETLLDATKDADLLVVGSRGRGGFSGLLLGSVSQQCAHHASCPTVIVRALPSAG